MSVETIKRAEELKLKLEAIQESEEIHTLPEVIAELQNIIESMDLSLGEILEWWEEDPKQMAYLMEFGSPEQQGFGKALVEAGYKKEG